MGASRSEGVRARGVHGGVHGADRRTASGRTGESAKAVFTDGNSARARLSADARNVPSLLGLSGIAPSLVANAATQRTSWPAARKLCLTCSIDSSPKWKTLAASTASAPASTASQKCCGLPAPPLATIGR